MDPINYIDSNLALQPFFSTDPTITSDFEREHTSRVLSGEKRLLLAVLADAIDCLRFKGMRTRKKRTLYEEAVAWIERDDDGPFSFAYVCAAFGFNPAYTKQRLLNEKK